MVEVHPEPDQAHTDATQQLAPTAFGELLQRLVVKRERPDDAPDFESRLASLRCRIDDFDAQILTILSKRQEVSEAIGDMKRDLAVTVLQPGRWDEVLRDRLEQARSLGLPEDLVKEILEAIHEASIQRQSAEP